MINIKKLNKVLLGIMVFSLGILNCSCVQENGDPNLTKVSKIEYSDKYKITEFTYKDHQYIQFKEPNGNGTTAGVVHDPACKCNKIIEEANTIL